MLIPVPIDAGPHREHGRAVLERVGQTGHARVVGQAGVAVARGQSRVQEGLLRGVVSLGLTLLGLCQRGGRRRRRRVPATKLRQLAG